ncbi:MAG: C2 domain-containing protein [Polyangia bacterium]
MSAARPLLLVLLFAPACGAPPLDAADGGAVSDGGDDAGADAGPADLADLSPAPRCSPAVCAGCCDGDICQPGVTASACGTKGAACMRCMPTTECVAGGRCMDTLAGSYQLTVESASIDVTTPAGLCWDLPCGAPDPYLTLHSYGTTQAIADTYSPRWAATFTVTYSALRSGIQFSIFDQDVTFDDVITSMATLRPSDTEIKAGRFEIPRAGAAASIRFSLRKL